MRNKNRQSLLSSLQHVIRLKNLTERYTYGMKYVTTVDKAPYQCITFGSYANSLKIG
ncbi:hypothetical protein [Virgibacillus pantothenticus]|uniref:hypothetical protein n=1 Tax=Virgibacillus pantothenticus TaxID=1473 RepID=UPI001C2492E9|nr:hypothetical protein [Virgibacillus pantothenticus]